MKISNVKMLPMSNANSNLGLATLVLATLATLATFAASALPLVWRADWPDCKPVEKYVHRGTDVELQPTWYINKEQADTTGWTFTTYCQTNAVGPWFGPMPGAYFSHTNDVGAASYNVIVRAQTPGGDVNYTAFARLRMLDSPGFTPGVLPLPTQSLDFADVTVFNAPYYTKDETDERIVALAPAPGNYATVSNRAINAVQTTDTDWLDAESKMGAITASGDEFFPWCFLGRAYFADELVWPGDGYNYHLVYAESAMRWTTWHASPGSEDMIDEETGRFLTQEDIAYLSDIAAAATAATNYTDEAIANIDLTGYATTHETETAIRAATNNLVSAVELPGEVYRIVAGTNIVDVITNYDSVVHAPSRYLQQLDDNGVWKTIWAETNGLARTLAAANAATAAATNALDAVKADRAWSKYTSALGAPAPEGTTWISTPTTVIAGGYEYARTVTSSGQYWFLTSNGMTLDQGATNSFLNVSAPDGTPIFRIEKTDSQPVGVNASAISMVGSVAVISVPVVGAHPLARVSTSLRNAPWHEETEDGMPQGSPASVTWSGSSGAWVATIDFGSLPQGFCRFEQVQEGITKIVNDGVTELSGGILFNGVKYMPTVNGNKLEFVAQ